MPVPTPLAYWHLNETSGTSAADAQGGAAATANGGLVMGGTDAPAGIGGVSPLLDGVGNYLQLASAGLVAGLSTFTIACWVKTSDTDGAVYCERPSPGLSVVRLGVSTSRTVYLRINDAAGGQAQALSAGFAGQLPNNAWCLLAGRRNGTSMDVCINGQVVATATPPAGALSDPGIDARAGVDRNGPTSFFAGGLRRLRVWNVALTDDQLWELYRIDAPVTRQSAFAFPCAPTGVWRNPLADDAPLHSNSANFITEFTRLRGVYNYGLTTTSYSVPVFIVPAGQPTQPVRIQGGTSNPGGQDLYDALQAVPVPANAFSANGTDAHMCIYQPSTGKLWEFWVAKQALLKPNTISGVDAAGSLTPTDYHYAVCPQNANGENTATTAGIKVTIVNGGAQLTWERVAGATGYGIYRRLESGNTFQYLTTVTDPGTGTNATFSDDGSITPDAGRTILVPTYQNGVDAATTTDWGCQYAGQMDDVPASIGVYSGTHANWGSTATSLPNWGGLITINEALDAAAGNVDAIPHAVAMAIPITEASTSFFYPAKRTDGGATGANKIREGTRFRLPAALDLSTLGMSPFCWALARAFQKYGGYVRDVSGGVTIAYVEDRTRANRDQYTRALNGKDTLSSYGSTFALKNFPWTSLQVVDPAYTQAQSAAGSWSPVPVVQSAGRRRARF